MAFLLLDVTLEVAALTWESFLLDQNTISLFRVSDARFTNRSGPVVGGLSLAQIGVVQLIFGEIRVETPDTVSSSVLSREYTGPVGHANRCGYKGVLKEGTLRGHFVDDQRMDNLLPIQPRVSARWSSVIR
jgi:hypothetical protein